MLFEGKGYGELMKSPRTCHRRVRHPPPSGWLDVPGRLKGGGYDAWRFRLRWAIGITNSGKPMSIWPLSHGSYVPSKVSDFGSSSFVTSPRLGKFASKRGVLMALALSVDDSWNAQSCSSRTGRTSGLPHR